MSAVPISVVIPFYNGHEYLARALASIHAQSVKPAEVIVVDDGSAEPLRDVPASLSEVAIRVVRHDANRGIPHTRNTGVRHARHDWICFLDQDDEWLPDKLERQWRAVTSADGHAGNAVFYSQAIRNAGAATVRWPGASTIKRLGRSPAVALRELLLRGNLIPHITMLLHRRVLAAAGGFDERWRGGADDFALVLTLAANGVRFMGMPAPLAVRHDTSDGYSHPESFLADDKAIIDDLAETCAAARPYRRAAASAAHFRCARGVAASDPVRARALFDEAVSLYPLAVRARLGRALLRIGPGAADVLTATRDRILARVRRSDRP